MVYSIASPKDPDTLQSKMAHMSPSLDLDRSMKPAAPNLLIDHRPADRYKP